MARERDDSGSRGLPDELRGEERSLEALRARQLADSPGLETPGPSREMADGILTETCIECGKEYIFEDLPPPPDLTCDKCGNVVFRSFFTARGYDEVEEDFRASTERDLALDDAPDDVTESDILDLDNI